MIPAVEDEGLVRHARPAEIHAGGQVQHRRREGAAHRTQQREIAAVDVLGTDELLAGLQRVGVGDDGLRGDPLAVVEHDPGHPAPLDEDPPRGRAHHHLPAIVGHAGAERVHQPLKTARAVVRAELQVCREHERPHIEGQHRRWHSQIRPECRQCRFEPGVAQVFVEHVGNGCPTVPAQQRKITAV